MAKKSVKANKPEKAEPGWLDIGIPGFSELLSKGVPRGHTILVAGGCGTGKTIFCLQALYHGLQKGEKCLYVTLEEPEENLLKHMRDFGWDIDKYVKNGSLVIKKIDPFEISRSIEGMLAKAKGELMIELKEVSGLLPKGFRPDRIAIDSLSALAAAFTEKEIGYRIYIEQLFNYFRSIGATSFLISEAAQSKRLYSRSGVEEFLADGVFVLYNLAKGNLRVRAVEILKLRGADHKQRIVPLTIEGGTGMKIYPTQEVFEQVKRIEF